MNRLFIIAVLLLSTFAVMADKKMTIQNADTGESFEVMVPDGLRIYEYNGNWLDSIPYLVEHARWKELWAFEALAECYRYGKGGVGKSMFNAIMCYEEAGKFARDIAEDAYVSNPVDEFGLIDHLMEGLDKKRISEEDAILLIDGLSAPKPEWIVFLREILRQKHEDRNNFIYSRLTPDSSSDEFLIGFACLAMDDSNVFDNTFINVSDYNMRKIRKFCDKLPPIYDVIAEKMWRKYEEGKEDKDKYLSAALECMYNADRMGFLSKHNMVWLLTYIEENGIDNCMPFSSDDLARFDTICPKEYRDYRNSFVVVEGDVVEMDESPVKQIEE